MLELLFQNMIGGFVNLSKYFEKDWKRESLKKTFSFKYGFKFEGCEGILLEANIEENLDYFGFGDDFLNITAKA